MFNLIEILLSILIKNVPTKCYVFKYIFKHCFCVEDVLVYKKKTVFSGCDETLEFCVNLYKNAIVL